MENACIRSHLMALCFFLTLLTGCGGRHVVDAGSITLAPEGIYEDCLDLTPKQVMTFSYSASAPVDFNVHYHEGEQVFYPVTRQQSPLWLDGSFLPNVPHLYCLMWTNAMDKTIDVSFEFGFHPVMPHHPMPSERHMMQ